ncbi:hypothetical protein ACFO5R_08155 [Halosolutus amylolyticus]|uniref:Uncharacterized protein n=1 Tax=Halosolutus amylolyticus TaxID=2932267 RepID=A0ABD5PN06_9EURY|nr:hypothetical protein [Halosolutus amylolyticus]
MSSVKILFGTFVLVFALTVGTLTGGAMILDDGTPTSDVDHDHIDSSLIADQTEDGGEITMESDEPENTIVIHTGSASAAGIGVGQPLPIRDQPAGPQLSVGSMDGPERGVGPLASALVANGHEVVYYQDERQDGPLADKLDEADAFVALGTASLSVDERDAITEFADAGGRTVIAADPGSSDDIDEIASSQGLYTEAGYVYNLVENDNNYLGVFTGPSGVDPLTDGVEEAVLRGASPVGTSQGTTVLETTDGTRHSTTREAGTYGVAAVNDNVAMIGDSSFMAPENAHRADNDVLVGNVADFLVTGEQPSVDLGGGDEMAPGGEFQSPETGP